MFYKTFRLVLFDMITTLFTDDIVAGVLTGDGANLRRPVPGGRLGLLRRVQPPGRAHAVGLLAADPDDPGGAQGARRAQQQAAGWRRRRRGRVIADQHRARRQAGMAAHRETACSCS